MATVSKEEYLKKYLSVNAEEKKKKKRKKVHAPVAKVPKSRIVDDDVDFSSLLPENLTNTLDEDVGDNDPTVAEVIDERPEHVKQLEKYRSSGAWKILGQDGTGDKSGSDLSPMQHHSDSDQSPPRRQRHDSDSDQSPPRRQRHDSDSDQSPPRRQRHDSDSDQSPPRKQRYDSNQMQTGKRKNNSDLSPPRKRKPRHSDKQFKSRFSDNIKTNSSRHDSDTDQSPPRRQVKDSDSDQSPPRRLSNQRKSGNNENRSPTRRRRHASDSDQSPPRRRRHDSDSDQSPPRRRRHNSDSDQSPPRRRRHNSDSDQSPPRRQRHDSDSDQSPPRNKKQNEKVEKTLGGKKAGLSSATQMRLEADELKRKEEEKFRQISDERLGKGAATVFRDKSGKRRDLAEERRKESEEAKKKDKEDEKFKTWGKGLKQIEERGKLLEDALHEVNKPLARYKDDEDLDQMLREMDRAEDPMLAFIKKKKKNTDPVKEKPKYKGPAPPPNRFGIMPGYRWDGVDRSNGFEKQIFSKQAERKATAAMAYKWSVEDM